MQSLDCGDLLDSSLSYFAEDTFVRSSRIHILSVSIPSTTAQLGIYVRNEDHTSRWENAQKGIKGGGLFWGHIFLHKQFTDRIDLCTCTVCFSMIICGALGFVIHIYIWYCTFYYTFTFCYSFSVRHMIFFPFNFFFCIWYCMLSHSWVEI